MREKLLLAALWTICLVVVAYFGYRAVEAISQMQQVVAAVISAIAVIIGAIITHGLKESHEREMERIRVVQQNYKELIERIAPFIRDPESSSVADSLAVVHLLSWVVGSPAVVEATLDFMEKRDRTNLQKLLGTMRSDLQLSRQELSNINLGIVFKPVPPPKAPASL